MDKSIGIVLRKEIQNRVWKWCKDSTISTVVEKKMLRLLHLQSHSH